MSGRILLALVCSSPRLVTAASGGRGLLETCSAMAAGVELCCNGLLLPEWQRTPISVSYFADETKIPERTPIFRFLDADPTQPGDLGWHDETAAGVVEATILVAPVLDNGGGLLDGGTAAVSLASVLGHEVNEAILDPLCNLWAVRPDGTYQAFEVSDPPEGELVPVKLPDGSTVEVSDAVLPRYFDDTPPSGARYSVSGKMVSAFGMLPGGYMLIADTAKPGAPVSSVFGERMPAWKRALKTRRGSRGARRRAAFA